MKFILQINSNFIYVIEINYYIAGIFMNTNKS